jgi:signal transduction histidine kinase
MRRLRVQLTVLVALLGMLVLAWGAAIFLGSRNAARSNASIQSTVDPVSPFRAMAAKHTLRTKLPGSLPVVWGDPDKVEQILTNLVGNAIKYSPGGGEVLVTVDHDGETVQVSVRDQESG